MEIKEKPNENKLKTNPINATRKARGSTRANEKTNRRHGRAKRLKRKRQKKHIKHKTRQKHG